MAGLHDEIHFPLKVFAIASVADLPPPFAMSFCSPFEIARSMTRAKHVGTQLMEEQIGDAFLRDGWAQLGGQGDGGPACRSHQIPWAQVAPAAVEVLLECRTHRLPWTSGAIQQYVRASHGLAAQEANAVVEIFEWPIEIRNSALFNGQHRRCALHVAGVTQIPILQS